MCLFHLSAIILFGALLSSSDLATTRRLRSHKTCAELTNVTFFKQKLHLLNIKLSLLSCYVHDFALIWSRGNQYSVRIYFMVWRASVIRGVLPINNYCTKWNLLWGVFWKFCSCWFLLQPFACCMVVLLHLDPCKFLPNSNVWI